MSVEICGYGHGGAALGRAVTSCATDTAHLHVLRMIELHAEADKPRGKRFQRARFHVGVTDGADWTFGIGKLLRVTSGARQMLRSARAFRHGRVRVAPVTKQAGKP